LANNFWFNFQIKTMNASWCSSFFMGAGKPPFFVIKRGLPPGRPLQFRLAISGFLTILVRLAAAQRQPPKNGKNHSWLRPHFRLRPCPANAMA
jgi:hypothetical protein